MPLWREVFFEVKSVKNWPVQSTIAPCQKWAKREGFVAVFTTLHYTTLRYTTLQLQLQLQLQQQLQLQLELELETTNAITLHYATLH